ncbi:helix-turn-helix transcriptional regulator [Amycolatopsis sp.]|uniref:helix-turn-helix domain-containing protein n=1 Tax=Amycolatopsis sp. TaxID=37632 RepID=UPI002B540E4D|nr:helix-turn-helix transcriptional regulator [Amycolatopsis sp.]HVV13672.1 helix-turn-helix transcriptional regulator [Amycolatopsis sp.]
MGPTVRRMVLGAQLRRLRERSGVARAEAAREIRASESKISRMELGRVGCKERDVLDLLRLYRADDAEAMAWAVDMVRQANETGWWQQFGESLPAWFDTYLGLEEAAWRIRTYEMTFVPGLLQTQAYARAVTSHGDPALEDEASAARVAVRMRRQSLLTKPSAPKLWAIFDESVLHRPVGGPPVLKAQLRHLLELLELPNVSVQIVPFERSGYAGEGAFTVLQFAEPELPNVVYIEHRTGALYLERRDDVEQYGRSFDRLTVDAPNLARSKALLHKRLAEI